MFSQCAMVVLTAAHLLSFASSSAASSVPESSGSKRNVIGSASAPRLISRQSYDGFDDPLTNGGSMLTIVNGTYPAGLGEPLNTIVSTQSDQEVLVKSLDNGGFLNYMLSAGLGEECLGQHLGSLQEANLGDNQGNVSEVEELRWNYGDPYLGTCRETFDGGLHLRYWIQNTTGAYFMAVSMEKNLASGHDIPLNGYNLGRNYLVGNVTQQSIEPRTVTNQTTLSGQSSWNNYTYQTDVRFVSGLLQNSSDGINHYLTVQEDGYPAIDGLVAVLTVKIVSRPKTTSGALSSIHISAIALLTSLTVGAALSLF